MILLSDSLKGAWRSIGRRLRQVRIYQRVTYHPKSREDLHRYWKQPWDGANLPEQYLSGGARSRFLTELVSKYVAPEARIMEVGCNVGRNLQCLFQAGFRNLEGIEISERAVRLLERSYVELAAHARIYTASAEEVIKGFQDDVFDVLFTMAVLEHIHTDSEWIFHELVRVTEDLLITIEDEYNLSWRHFPRNYREIFEPLGMEQIEELNCRQIDGLGERFFARVFRKRDRSK